MDVNVNWQMHSELAIYAHINNLFDVDYSSVAISRVENIEGVENRGLHARLGIRYDF